MREGDTRVSLAHARSLFRPLLPSAGTLGARDFSSAVSGFCQVFMGGPLWAAMGRPWAIEDFVQEIGRAGRDGRKAVSALFYQGKHLRKCEKAVNRYAKESTCLRNLLMSEFEELNNTVGNHSCCLSCHLKCLCSDTKCNIDIPFTHHISQVRGSSKESLKKRKTTVQQRVLLEE